MNFMAKSSNQGFYGECQNQNMMSTNTSSRGKHHFPSSSSSSSTQPHKSLVSLAFHYHQQQQWGSWLENKFEPLQPSPEEITSLRCYTGGAEKLELMCASAAAAGNNDGDDDPTVVAAANPDNDVRRGDPSSDGLRLRVVGGSTVGTSTVSVVVEREHMFDKVVTPSDVGKLNRLVIPKQHAEKYFPLDSSTNEKGLLLNFEDRNGKPWRFRYSYWNSSQSYVMTKGWSRFVKDKKLDAGDIVSFHRGVGELGKDRLFIDWKRRSNAPELPPSLPTLSQLPQHYFSFYRSTHTWSPLFSQPQASPATWDHSHFPQPNPTNYQPSSSSYGDSYGSGGPYGYNSVVNPCSSSVIYLGSAAAAAAAPQWPGMVQVQSCRSGGAVEPMPMVFESVPVLHGKAAAKRLRLFGVNMDCPISESDDCDMLSSATIPHSTMVPQPPHLSSSPIPTLQLRIYNGSPLAATQSELLDKGNPSSKSFDLDI